MRRWETETAEIGAWSPGAFSAPPKDPSEQPTPRPSIWGDDEPTQVAICARCGQPARAVHHCPKEETHGDR